MIGVKNFFMIAILYIYLDVKYHNQNLATGTFLEFQDSWFKHKQFFF